MATRYADLPVRIDYGMLEVRHHRRGRAAELERAGAMTVSAEQRRVLQLLAGSPDGCTEAIVLAYGFKMEMLAGLILDGLATPDTELANAGRRQVKVVRLRITEAGRRALAPGRLI